MKKFEYDLRTKIILETLGKIWFEKQDDEELKEQYNLKLQYEKEYLVLGGIKLLGEEGWELCGISDDIFYFKREKNKS